jgi:indoleacetamide hydrolase
VGPAIGRYLTEYRAGLSFEQLVSQASPGVRDDLRQVFPGGSDFVSDGAYQILVNERLPEFRRLYREYFSRTGVAAIVFPATAVPALPIGAEGDVTIGAHRVSLFNALARNITPAGSATTPGLVLPAGLTSSGLPVAIELDGPPGTDRALLALGMSVAEVVGPLPPPRSLS